MEIAVLEFLMVQSSQKVQDYQHHISISITKSPTVIKCTLVTSKVSKMDLVFDDSAPYLQGNKRVNGHHGNGRIWEKDCCHYEEPERTGGKNDTGSGYESELSISHLDRSNSHPTSFILFISF
ncbi:hypothetical protein RF11_08796 [Thelohanellus kitauei]|uniref:Uncharacterized protein n=1 Tax=Thelohanellus kitauei TaxID=669202 RepID=A0A0C2MQQ1_THEKT|nr:hypothetical protein RF11_08796 [Thelohanellus kitauei]